mmetsp:Transcript_3958/g.9639  ORF Transcript_3958/g.9639 Transcript_3958/m.9639 type:complete len:229 (-) Transcript_3958:161-847(-)
MGGDLWHAGIQGSARRPLSSAAKLRGDVVCSFERLALHTAEQGAAAAEHRREKPVSQDEDHGCRAPATSGASLRTRHVGLEILEGLEERGLHKDLVTPLGRDDRQVAEQLGREVPAIELGRLGTRGRTVLAHPVAESEQGATDQARAVLEDPVSGQGNLQHLRDLPQVADEDVPRTRLWLLRGLLVAQDDSVCEKPRTFDAGGITFELLLGQLQRHLPRGLHLLLDLP